MEKMVMQRRTTLLVTLASLAAMSCGLISVARSADADEPEKKDLVLRGDAQCTRCHDESEAYPVLSIAKTKHGTMADGATPTCTSCHGESKRHIENAKNPGETERPKPDRTFHG